MKSEEHTQYKFYVVDSEDAFFCLACLSTYYSEFLSYNRTILPRYLKGSQGKLFLRKIFFFLSFVDHEDIFFTPHKTPDSLL